jgi:hypothetical protein
VGCVEENRNRKKKSCCSDWFCNQNIPRDWLTGDQITSDETTPPTTTPTLIVPNPDNSTRPPPAIISPVAPPTEEETNCTVAESDKSISLTPCAGPGSVPDLTPITSSPIPSLPGAYYCFCSSCTQGYCTSGFGCSTVYSSVYDSSVPDGRRIELTLFCLDEQTFGKCGVQERLECCIANMCNTPHSLVTVDPGATPTGLEDNNSMATEPITAATNTLPSETTSETDATDMDAPTDTVNPSTTDTTDTSEGEDMSFLFYALSAILAVLIASLVLVMVVLIFCCYGYHKRTCSKRPSSSPRLKHIAMATRQENAGAMEMGSRFNDISLGATGNRALLSRDGSKVESSCTTESTYTQSSPESTV